MNASLYIDKMRGFHIYILFAVSSLLNFGFSQKSIFPLIPVNKAFVFPFPYNKIEEFPYNYNFPLPFP